jgi:hypothetical protein
MLKSKRTFEIECKATADNLEEVLKYEYPAGTIQVETIHILSITCDRKAPPKNLVAEHIQKLLKTKGIEAKVVFRDTEDIKPKVPKDVKITYYIDEHNSSYGQGEYRTRIVMATQKMLDSQDFRDQEQLEIIQELLNKTNLCPDYEGNIFWFEYSPKEIVKALTATKKFEQSTTPIKEW